MRAEPPRQFVDWDAMVLVSARRPDCTTVLWSEALSDGQTVARVTVRNPFAPATAIEG